MKQINRRTVLGATAAASVVPARFSIGKPGGSPNSKLNIAMIGAGNIARMAYRETRGEHIVALADVDSNMFLQHAEIFPDLKKAKQFTDFRVMLDKMDKEIDAVCINTPDHTHFVATMDAMRRGKHVCTQKPLTHNIWEARALKRAKAKYGVVTNMAVQGHTFDGIRQMREWYEAGVFGQINEVHSWKGGPFFSPYNPNSNGFWMRPPSFPLPTQKVPENLDWDLWLGPSTSKFSYCSVFHPKSWRGFHDFGNGMFGDWAPHITDAPVWILDLYEPICAELEETEGGNEWMVPEGNRVRWDFAKRGQKKPCAFYWYNGSPQFKPEKPKRWTWSEELPQFGTLYYGEKQSGYTDERSNHPRLVNKEDMKAFKAAGYPEERYPRIKGGPFGEWVRAIKGEGPEPGANFDFASPFTETMLVGVLAARFGGRIEWDTKRMRITNRPELNAYVKEPIRAGWDYAKYL